MLLCGINSIHQPIDRISARFLNVHQHRMDFFESSRMTAHDNDNPLSMNSLSAESGAAKWQGVHLHRFTLAALTSTLFALLVLLLYGLEFFPETAAMGVVGSILVFTCLFYLIFRSRLNLRASDPSLALPQMCLAALHVLYVMYVSDQTRGVVAIVFAMILMLGIYRYSMRALLLQAALMLSAYTTVVMLAWQIKPGKVNIRVEIVSWLVVAIALPWFAWMGGYLNTLRQKMKSRKVFYRTIWESCSDGVIVIDANHRIQYANPAMTTIFGYPSDAIIGMELARLRLDAVQSEEPSGRRMMECLALHRNGHELPVEANFNDVLVDKDKATIAFIRDITERKLTEERVRHLAHHDVLTGLPNRALLEDRMRQALAYAARSGNLVWVIFLDLDHFKFINDSLGHKAGDQFLTMTSERLRAAIRETDTVARRGGDEFVLVLSEINAGGHLSVATIQRIVDIIAQPLMVNGHELSLTCSMGIAVYPTDGKTPESLVEHADIAMYRAKQKGRNNYQFYKPAMNEGAFERLRIEADLRMALERNELLLHYQPQVDMVSGRIVGAEALIRWRHPELGLIAPARFIGVAEETGLIVQIGSWVMRTACAQNTAWQHAGFAGLRVAVNLSARQFAQRDLVETIAAVLNATALAPEYLEIELTESLVMADVERTVGILREFKKLGVRLSLDDFGTGYSSLNYLKRFPIDVLKIDQTFVRDITLDPDDAGIVASIISLAHNLRLKVIAEGVETREQLSFLQQLRCDEIQGYLISKPVPPAEFEKLLKLDKKLLLQSVILAGAA
jgi:diguanylate cyclase (GGDEF)-like protein/PAS domain S-box-containing protein